MSTGRDIIAAFGKGAVWGTAVSVDAAGKGAYILSEGLPAKFGEHLRNEELAHAFIENIDKGNVDIAGDVAAFLRYQGLDTLIAIAMGTAGAPVQQGATTAYKHTWKLINSLAGLFGTLAIDKSVSVWEYPSVKVHGFSISCEAGQPAQITFNMIADDLLRSGDESPTNSSLSSVTYASTALRLLFDKLTFRINAQGGAGLASPTDDVSISRFTLTYNRPLSGLHVLGQNTITEPTADGIPEVTLEVGIDEYTADAFLNDIRQATEKKADIYFDSGIEADTAFNYDFRISFPRLIPREGDAAIGGPGKIPESVTFEAIKAASNPTGMDDTGPFYLDVINQLATDALA